MNDNKEQEQEQFFEDPVDNSLYSEDEIQEATAEIQQLSPEAYIDMKRYIDSVTDQDAGSEAAVVAATTLYGQHGGYMYLSARSSDVVKAIDRLVNGIKYASTYGLRPGEQGKSKSYGASATASPPDVSTSAPAAQPAPVNVAQSAQPQPAPQPAPAVPQPQTAPTSGDIDVVEVATIRHQISPTGVHFLNVKGGKWMKHGYPAWIEVVEAAGVNIEALQVGTEFQAPAELKYAWIDLQKKKVVRFAGNLQ